MPEESIRSEILVNSILENAVVTFCYIIKCWVQNYCF